MSVFDHARTHPDGLALDDLTRTRTWAEVADRAVRIANLLTGDLKLGPEDHVAMLMGNRVEFCELLLGATLAGVWITPINWHLVADEVGYIVEDSDSRVLFTDPDHAAVAADATDVDIIEVGPELDRLLADASDAPVDPDRPAGGSMLYTSGTTGRPKGVRRPRRGTVGSVLAASGAAGGALGLDGGGPHLVTGPLYHAAPLGFASIDWHSGAPLVIMPRWDTEGCLRLIDERGIRNSHLVPTMFVRLLGLPEEVRDRFSGASLNVVLHGAAPIAPDVKRRMIDWWGPVLVEYWGSTEGSVFTLVDSQTWLEHPGTVGKAVPTYEVFAVDETGRRLPPGEVGTLYCRNTLTTEVFEYYKAPDKTTSAFIEPGVFTMGDIGWVDEEGYVFLSDRAANMIISGGVNIYPAEIEKVLIGHPAIADVAVFGIPHPEWGEEVKAAVELADGVTWSPRLEREILSWARERLAAYKVPRSIDVHDALPRHPTGKLYTRLLRDAYWEGAERRI